MATKLDPIEALTESVKSYLNEIVVLKATVQQREHRIAELEGLNHGLSSQLQQEQARVKEQQAEVLERNKKIRAMEQSMAELEANASALESQNAELNDALRSAKETIAGMKKK